MCQLVLVLPHSTQLLINGRQGPARDVYEQIGVFRGPQNAEGITISLVKWGWGVPTSLEI